MKPIFLARTIICCVALSALSACGGGGGGASGSPSAPPAPIPGDVLLSAVVLNASAGTVSVQAGRLNEINSTGNLGGLSGTLSNNGRGIALNGGGAVEFAGAASAGPVRFTAAQGATNTIGIAGIITPASELPAGQTVYRGNTVITAQSDNDLFELTGNATITADFGGGAPSVTTSLTGLSGTRQPAIGAIQPVSNAGSLTLNGSTISGATFRDGTASLASSVLSLSGGEAVNVSGAFYGENGSDVGAVFFIDDGATKIFGDFVAN